MPRGEIIPSNDGAFLLFHDNLKTQATALAATLGITADDQAELAADNTASHTTVSDAVEKNGVAQTANGLKNDTRREVAGHLRLLIKRIKGHRNYTATLGKQLGIEGAADTTDMTMAQPTLVANPLAHGAVEIAFNKSKADGVNLYSQREGNSEFVFLARDTASPYVDNRALLVAGKPEVRKYRAIYVINDAEIGIVSDDVNVVCQP